jgi:hypothetical protein
VRIVNEDIMEGTVLNASFPDLDFQEEGYNNIIITRHECILFRERAPILRCHRIIIAREIGYEIRYQSTRHIYEYCVWIEVGFDTTTVCMKRSHGMRNGEQTNVNCRHYIIRTHSFSCVVRFWKRCAPFRFVINYSECTCSSPC